MVEEAASIGIDMSVDFTVTGVDNKKHDLLLVPFNPSNINLFGTKIMDIIFDEDEMVRGTFNPTKHGKKSLDPKKVNLIKGRL